MSERQRRYRRNLRKGVSVYRVSGTDRLLHALINAGRLTDADTLDRSRIEGELTAVVQEWADRWT